MFFASGIIAAWGGRTDMQPTAQLLTQIPESSIYSGIKWITYRPGFCAKKDNCFQILLDCTLQLGILLHLATSDKMS